MSMLWYVSMSMLHVHVNVHSTCSCPCMSMFMFHACVIVHAVCPCPWTSCLSVSLLHVCFYAAFQVHAAHPCPCCMPMTMVHVHDHDSTMNVHIHVTVYVHIAWTWGPEHKQKYIHCKLSEANRGTHLKTTLCKAGPGTMRIYSFETCTWTLLILQFFFMDVTFIILYLSYQSVFCTLKFLLPRIEPPSFI